MGASNIRVNFETIPASMLSVKADNPAINANANIHNANGYMAMTTTSVASGAAIGCNILTFNTSGFHQFTTGSYRICTLRWNILGGYTNGEMTFRVPPQQFPSIVFNGLTQLIHPSGFNTTNPLVTSNINLMTEVPKEFGLFQNYPNPFNPTTSIRYDIPNSSHVSIMVYDVTGKTVETLVDQQLEAGRYEATWDATRYSSGIYFYKIITADFSSVKRMVLIK